MEEKRTHQPETVGNVLAQKGAELLEVPAWMGRFPSGPFTASETQALWRLFAWLQPAWLQPAWLQPAWSQPAWSEADASAQASSAAPPPGLAPLRSLVRAFLIRVPFENISKLLRVPQGAPFQLPTLEEWVEGVLEQGLGGTCFTNTPYLLAMLSLLGYRVSLLAANMGSTLDCHTVGLVSLDEGDFLVDVGYGGPLYEPMLCGSTPSPCRATEPGATGFSGAEVWYETQVGSRTYRLGPGDDQTPIRMTVWEDGECFHGYQVKAESRTLGSFWPSIQRSYRQGTTFMSAFVVTRNLGERTVSVVNRKLSRLDRNGKHITMLSDEDALVEAVRGEAQMTTESVRRALEILREFNGVRPFDVPISGALTAAPEPQSQGSGVQAPEADETG